MILRSLFRDPKLARPLQRAVSRRFDDDFWLDDWPSHRVRRARSPSRYDNSPLALMEQMDRQMSAAMNQMQELAHDLSSMDSLMTRYDPENWVRDSNRSSQDVVVRRTEDGGLQLALDVADFKPEDLKIKLVDDNHLVVEAVSETSGKDSYQKSHFKRWFRLPEDCKVEEIKSQLTEDKQLLVDLPTNKPLEAEKARTIPIEMAKPKETTTTEENKKQ